MYSQAMMDTTQAKRISLAEESHPDLQNTNDLKQSRSREDLFDWILHHIRDTKDMDMIKGSKDRWSMDTIPVIGK